MYIVRIIAVVMLGTWLAACGSDSDGVETIDLNAQLDQGASWSQTIDLGSFPSVVESPQHGQIQLNSSSISYTPQPSFRGSDSAVIEGSRAIYRISFTVDAVNQPPRLVETIIEVTADRQISGRLVAYDQDDDPVSYSLVSAPQRGEFTLQSNGEFHFVQDELRLPNASFVVDLSDGVNDPVRETVELLPAYGTNEEKAAYYYHSRHSHLLQAEIRLANLNSDADTELSYIAIAEGYVDASMDDEVERIIANHVHSQQSKARAYRTLAKRYKARGEADKAQESRLRSVEYQMQLIVDNGIENTRAADTQFLWGLYQEARSAGETESMEHIIQNMRSLVAALGGSNKEHVNAYAYMATAFRAAVLEASEIYADTGLESDRQTAVELNHEFANLAYNHGYQIHRASGERRYVLGPMNSAWAAEHYYVLNEPEYAKRQVARTLAYYQKIDYDSDYQLDARPYAARTALDYPSGLRMVAPYFFLLYPNEPSLPQQIVEDAHDSSHREIANIQTEIDNARFLRRVLDGESIDDVMDDIMTMYESSPWEQVRKLTEDATAAPRLGAQLRMMGHSQLASRTLERAFEVLVSPEYADENRHVLTRMTGVHGCQKQVRAAWTLGETSVAQERAQQCEQRMLPLYAADDAKALRDMAELYVYIDSPQRAVALIPRLEYALSQQDPIDAMNTEATNLVPVLVAIDESATAVKLTQDLFERLEQAEIDGVETLDEHLTVLTRLNDTGMVLSFRRILHPIVVELRGREYNNPDYQSWMLALTDKIAEFNTSIVDRILALPATEQAGIAQKLIQQLSFARQYTLAEETISKLAVGEVERIQLLAKVSEIQAIQDDFPFSPIATVDTDVDGRANFFAVAATSEQLADTDIELDDDADGDGVPDDEDPLPLG